MDNDRFTANTMRQSQHASISPAKRSGGLKKALLILIAIVLGALAGYGSYSYIHKNAPKSNAQAKTIRAASTKEPTSTSTSSSEATAIIASLGIQFSIPNSLSDLTASVISQSSINGQSDTTVGLSTTILINDASDCAPAKAPLGTLSKTSGQYPVKPTAENSTGVLVKQFSDFYIAYGFPQATCSAPQQIQMSDRSLLKFINVQQTL